MHRNTLIDVISRVFKMFTDYVMHLEMLKGFENEESSQYSVYTNVISLLKQNLNQVNENLKSNQEFDALLNLFKTIKNFPVDLRNSKRKLLHVFKVLVERPSGIQSETGEPIMKQDSICLLLFHDCLVAVKAIKTSQHRPIYNAHLLTACIDPLKDAKLYYMYHFNYLEVDTYNTGTKNHLEILIAKEHFHTYYGDQVSSASPAEVDKEVERLMRPEASKVSLAMSQAKFSMLKNLSKLTLVTKSKTNKMSHFISSKMNLQKKTAPVPDSPAEPLQEGFSGSMSHVTLGLNQSYLNAKKVNSMMTMLADDKLRLEYIISEQDHTDKIVNLLESNGMLFGNRG